MFKPDERPPFPGSPFVPNHPLKRRLAYGVVGMCCGISSSFGNALVNVNLPVLGGDLGFYLAGASWLPAIYIATNASANLSLVRARVEFGIRNVLFVLLSVYALVGFAQIPFPNLLTAALTRGISGITAACLSSVAVFYMLQAFSLKRRILGLACGISMPQLGVALARLVPVDMLFVDKWHGLHLIEPAVALSVLALLAAFPFPPSEHKPAFERLDFVTFGLAISGTLLLCGVLGLGRVYWWHDTPFLGWMLVAALPLIAAALLVELHRPRPLLHIDWLLSGTMVRFGAIALLIRLALTEQTYGSVGLLTSGGLINDQLHTLFGFVSLSMVLGVIVTCLVVTQKTIRLQIAFAAAIVGVGSWLDSGATDLTRPPQLYLSQSLIGFGTTLFIGPALAFGLRQVAAKGGDYLISFIVMFNLTQNLGGYVGSALIGSYEYIQTQAHAVAISEDLVASNPEVVQRIEAGAGAISGYVVDPLLRQTEGIALLSQSLQTQSTVLAFDDVSRALAYIAFLTSAYCFVRIGWTAYAARRNAHVDEAL